MRYELTDPAGHLLDVVHNPAVTHLHAVLGPNQSGRDEEQPLYGWGNWCHNAKQPPFVLAWSFAVATTPTVAAP